MPRFDLAALLAGLLATIEPTMAVAESTTTVTNTPVATAGRAEEPTVLRASDLDFPELYSNWFDEDSIPARLRDLEGTRVRVVGWMAPPASETLRYGLLWIDNTGGASTFGRTYGICETLGVVVKQELKYERGLVTVEGRFRIRAVVRNRELKLLYRLDDASIQFASMEKTNRARLGR